MRVRLSVLKLVVMVPALLVSGVLGLMMLAVLPPVLGLLGFLAGGAALGVLAAGGLEGPAVQLLTRARAATEGERAVLAPVLAADGGTGMPAVRLYVRGASQPATPPAVAVGTSSLVVTPWLVEATYRGWITREEATAVVLHADGRHRAGRHRLEVAVLAATTPWRAVSAVARRVGQSFAWLPFLRFVWFLRGVVGAVAVVQSAMEDRAVSGAIAGVFVALTYLVPAAARAREGQLEVEADRLVVDRGLGVDLAGLLRRSGVPVRVERLQRLENRPLSEPVPVLQLASFSPN
jgi:hypothetical protein